MCAHVCVKYRFNLEQGEKIIKSSVIKCQMASKKNVFPNGNRGLAYAGEIKSWTLSMWGLGVMFATVKKGI